MRVNAWASGAFLALGLLLGRGEIECQDRVVLDGLPNSTVTSSSLSSSRVVVTGQDREDTRVTIVERDGKYIWKTRGNREVVLFANGSEYSFIDPRGGGYVKVFLSGFSADTPPGHVGFMEHATIGDIAFTYWGTTANWTPPAP